MESKTWKVSVKETRYVDYYVPAATAEEADALVEKSEDADTDFSHRTMTQGFEIYMHTRELT